MATELVLGPSFDNHIEAVGGAQAVLPPTPGRRGIAFHPNRPSSPGGNAHLVLQPASGPNDALPVNVHAFFVQPLSEVPPLAQRTPDWFFSGGGQNKAVKAHGFIPFHAGTTDEGGNFTVTAPGVTPSLQPYLIQTVLEYTKT